MFCAVCDYSSSKLKGKQCKQKTSTKSHKTGEQGWRSGESARLPPMCRHTWVEFVVGSLLCSERFSPGTPVFRVLKNQHFQIPILAWKVSPISAKALEDNDTKIK